MFVRWNIVCQFLSIFRSHQSLPELWREVFPFSEEREQEVKRTQPNWDLIRSYARMRWEFSRGFLRANYSVFGCLCFERLCILLHCTRHVNGSRFWFKFLELNFSWTHSEFSHFEGKLQFVVIFNSKKMSRVSSVCLWTFWDVLLLK